MIFGSKIESPRIPEGFIMTNSAGPEGQPPAAWVWSHYRGVAPAEPARPAEPAEPEQTTAAAAPDSGLPLKHSGLIGLGLAAAVIVIAGLTWLFTTGTASSPTGGETPPAAESAPQKSEAAPPAAETPATPAPTPATAAAPAEEAKPAAPAPAAPAKKHKKHKHEG
jgi:cytoskeletal protein RodZ